MIDEFLRAFFTIFIIMGTFGNIPIFTILTQKIPHKYKKKNANRIIIVASSLLFLFLFLGDYILKIFSISFQSFEIAGGIILMLIGFKYVLGLHIFEEKAEKNEFPIIPIATPLISGPGSITTVLILVQEYGYFITLLASSLNLFIAWFVLREIEFFNKAFGKHESKGLSKIIGLFVTAIGVEFIRKGILGI